MSRRQGLEPELPRAGVGALALACVACVVAVFVGCSAGTRNRVLTHVFDGVPTPLPTAAPGQTAAGAGAPGEDSRRAGATEHGPYAARLCNSCHDRAATNALLAPRDQLCFQCHEYRADKKFVHGPLASGGCLVCHDPHSSRYAALLVSQSETFCLECHDRQSLAKIDAHLEGAPSCTTCHDAHMSDQPYLLK